MPESDDFVLALLRSMRTEMGPMRADIGEVKNDLIEIKGRLGFLAAAYGSMSPRIDHIDGAVRILARNFDLVEATDAP
jgi:hypothetical protein